MITILGLAKARGLKFAPDGTCTAGDLAAVGFEALGGCCRCQATIAAYNAYPTKTGFWMCWMCVDESVAFQTEEEFAAWEKEAK